MILVICVLSATVIFSAVTLTLAVVYQDELVISEDEYRELRDDMRLTKARKEPDEQ